MLNCALSCFCISTWVLGNITLFWQTTFIARPTAMKNPAPNGGEELMKKVKKNMMETKVVPSESKKMSCICSPTNHAGSFRCHLHRASAPPPQISSCCTSLPNSDVGKLNSHQPLSRFGRASLKKYRPIFLKTGSE